MNPLVSIIITYYNYEKYIVDCLTSCFAQTYDNIEIIVVNDASEDKGYKKINLLAWQHKANLKLITHPQNRGIAESKNTGIENANGELIAFIDADDMLTPKSIAKRVKAFSENNELDFVHGFAYHVEGDYSYKECLGKKFKLHGKTATINAQTMMFKREVFEKYGLFHTLHSKEDKEMMWRLGIHRDSPLPALVKHHKVPDMCAYYRVHKDSAKHSRTDGQREKLLKKFNKRIARLMKEGVTKENTYYE